MEIVNIKYQFIEEIIKINDFEILLNLKNFLNNLKKQSKKQSEISKFAGIWSSEEANEISEIIKDCEKIDFNEW